MSDTKAKYWTGVTYPDRLPGGWEDSLGDILQIPACYCFHNADHLEKFNEELDDREDHYHFIGAFPNTTTYKHALDVFNSLQVNGKGAFNTIQPVNNIRQMYEYLIHNTETCKARGKHLYLPEDRKLVNNFDIGAYEQISIEEKQIKVTELCQRIIDDGIYNVSDFYMLLISDYDSEYHKLWVTYSGCFERLCKGNFQKMKLAEINKPF